MAPESPDSPDPACPLPAGIDGALTRFCGLVFEHPQTLVSAADRERLPIHVADSLTALPLLERHGVRTLVDLGSGGGFPAIPLALARPVLAATLMESVGWKARFLTEASTTLGLGLRLRVVADRAESVVSEIGREVADVGTARAVAPPIVVAELLAPFVRVGGRLLLWTTGAVVTEHGAREVRELGLAAPQVHRTPSLLRADAVLLEWPKVASTHERFPRRIGVAAKRPLQTPSC